MPKQNFDQKFSELFTAMVEIAFEYVNRNTKEVNVIYIYGSMEDESYFYNVFYKINGKMVELHQVNTVSKEQYDISDDRSFRLLELGIDYLEQIANLFESDGRQVPTLMKMIYEPKTGNFNNDISYDLHYSNDDERTNVDVFNEWFEEMSK